MRGVGDRKKSSPKEHYSWPLRRVVKVVRKGREHTDVLSCGHKVVWRGSSAWKQGDNDPGGRHPSRRCRDCYAEEQDFLDSMSRHYRGRKEEGDQPSQADPPSSKDESDGD